MKLLITGYDGFIGANFAANYKKKFDIYVPTAEELDLTNFADVNATLKDGKFDAVLHIAGKRDVLSDLPLDSADLIMFKNVQYASVLYGVKKLIVVSDASDMDLSRELINVSEDEFGKSVPQFGYGVGRYLVHSLAAKDKISTVLRFFGMYGGGSTIDDSRIAEILSHAVTGNKKIVLPANKTFSAVYIDDACKIISLFLTKDFEKGIYNVASPSPVTLFDFAKKARSYAKKDGRELELVLGDGYENELTANTEKLAKAIGSFKFTAFGTGVTKTLDYYKSHKSKLRASKETK